MVEGTTLVAEAVAAGVALEAVYADPRADATLLAAVRDAGVPVYQVGAGVLDAAVSTTTPQAVAAIAPWLDVAVETLAAAAIVVVLVGVGDPGNAGTLLRSAEAAGSGAVVFCAGAVDPYNPKCVRASAGAIFHVPVVLGGDPLDVLRHLADAGRRVLGTAARGGVAYEQVDLTAPTAVVLGSEPRGLPADVTAVLDATLSIPMQGRAESLNVGVTGSIICFEAQRQRRVLAARADEAPQP